MFWYWIVFISLMLLTLLEQFSNIGRQRAKIICFIYSIFFVFMSTIRWNQTLGDWEGYYNIFNWENIHSLKQVFTIHYWPFEPAYYLAMRMINYLTGSYSVLLFFMASVASFCFYRASVYLDERQIGKANNEFALGNRNNNKSTLIATYFIWWATSCASIFVVRTNIAVSICLLSIKYIENKKIWKFIPLILFASMFHFVAIVFFIVYPVYHKSFGLKKIFEGLTIALVVGTIGIQRIIPLVGMLGGRYAEKISSYNMNRTDNYAYLSYSNAFLVIRAMANTILIILIILYIGRTERHNLRFKGLFNIYIIGAFIQALTIGYNMELARVAVFFLSAQFFLLPYIFRIKGSSFDKLLYFIMLSVFMGVKMFSLLNSTPAYSTFTTVFSK